MNRLRILTTILIVLPLCPAAAGQSRFPAPDTSKSEPAAASGERGAIFRAVEEGLIEGDVRLFAAYFSRTVSLNIRGSDPGYYSANQAGEVLRHFLSNRKFPSFRFTTIDTGDHPFATGAATLTPGARDGRFQVYAALSREKSGWVISQFNIY